MSSPNSTSYALKRDGLDHEEESPTTAKAMEKNSTWANLSNRKKTQKKKFNSTTSSFTAEF